MLWNVIQSRHGGIVSGILATTEIHTTFRMQDRGRGIPADEIPRSFNALLGTVWCESMPDVGYTFFVHLSWRALRKKYNAVDKG